VAPSVEQVFKAAQWHEREIYDLLGVTFTGHSDLRRILLPDDWKGHPLLKDYMEEPEYQGMPTTRENPLGKV
jgi:NADH-quinone oxidoreductase subunit C